VIGSANRNADPLSPRVLSNGLLIRNLSSRGYSRTNARPPLAEESTAPNVRNPSCPPKRADPNYSQLPACSRCRFVFPRAPGAYVSAPSLHAGLHDNRASRQSQFLDGSDMILEDHTAPELTPQKGPTPTGCENRSASPRKPSWQSDVMHDQMATLPCAATDLAGRTMGGRPLSPRRGAY